MNFQKKLNKLSETDRIKKRYESRKLNPKVQNRYSNNTYNRFVIEEREKLYSLIVKSNFNAVNDLKVIEIGAGGGGNLDLFHSLGIPWKNIYANTLMILNVLFNFMDFDGSAVFVSNL